MTKTKATLRATLSPQALKRMEALKTAGSTTEQQRKEQQEQRQKRQKLFRTLDWLDETFPQCFNKDAPKPLKIKIEVDLFAAIKENDEFSNVNIRNALGFYTSRLAYQESFLTHDHRVDLDGKEAEALEQKHKDFAETRIEDIKSKMQNMKDD